MDAMMHCPNCEHPLRVPRNAEGHQARCSECGQVFTVPSSDQLFEETCSTWIEEDVEAVEADRHRRVEQMLDSWVKQRTPSSSASHGTPPPTLQPTDQPGAATDSTAEGSASTDTPQPGLRNEGEADSSRAASSGDRADAAPLAERQAESGGGSTATDVTQEVPAASGQPPPTGASDADTTGAGSDSAQIDPNRMARHPDTRARVEGDGRFPTNLHVSEPVPHLVVLSLDSAGVRLAFDSIWLDHAGFRGSMPFRCAFSSVSRDEGTLMARPMLFIDQARTDHREGLAKTLTDQHEYELTADRSVADLIHRMGKLDKLPYPFDLPMPYYVNTKYAQMALHCETRPRGDGGVTCEVVIPNVATARQWLANVNGVCGPEYALLAADTALLHGEAWKALSPRTRERILVWCKLRPQEQVKLYINDADLGHHDEGLGGLLVTDQRLIFCKHHHRGQIDRLKHTATIRPQYDGRLAQLRLEMGGQRTKMIKARESDVRVLAAELEAEGQVQLAAE